LGPFADGCVGVHRICNILGEGCILVEFGTDGLGFLVDRSGVQGGVCPVVFSFCAGRVGSSRRAVVPDEDFVRVCQIEISSCEVDIVVESPIESGAGELAGESAVQDDVAFVVELVVDVTEAGGGDGEVLGVDFEHVDFVAGKATEHGDQNTDQTCEGQAKRHSHAYESSETHIEDLSESINQSIDGSQ